MNFLKRSLPLIFLLTHAMAAESVSRGTALYKMANYLNEDTYALTSGTVRLREQITNAQAQYQISNLNPQEMDFILKSVFVSIYSIASDNGTDPLTQKQYTSLFNDFGNLGLNLHSTAQVLNQVEHNSDGLKSLQTTLSRVDDNLKKALFNHISVYELLNYENENRNPETYTSEIRAVLKMMLDVYKTPEDRLHLYNSVQTYELTLDPQSFSAILTAMAKLKTNPQALCDFHADLINALDSAEDEDHDETVTGISAHDYEALQKSVRQNNQALKDLQNIPEKLKNTDCGSGEPESLRYLIETLQETIESVLETDVSARTATATSTSVQSKPVIVGPCQVDQFIKYVKNLDSKVISNGIWDAYTGIDGCQYNLGTEKLSANEINVRVEISKGFILVKKFKSSASKLVQDLLINLRY